ncbi:MAG: GHKL domain-containing protein [Bacteroidetes bacterium]|nr:GHKL domain-containing protein [Bacteroidota bacterium]
MRLSKYKLALFYWGLGILCVPLQTIAQKPLQGSLFSKYSITSYTGDNGLISNNITSAIQAKTGFIWATTYNGIMRFDGKKVDVFDRGNIPFLATDAFYKIYEDNHGTLWFASQGSGLVFYKDSKFFSIDTTFKTLPKSVRSLLIEPDGNIWVGTSSQGLYIIENGKPRACNFPQLSQAGISDLVRDAEGNLWIATDRHGLYKFDGKNLLQVEGLVSSSVLALLIDKNKTLWVGTENGLNAIRHGKVSQYDKLKNFQVNCMITDSASQIWVGTELGLGRINPDNASLEILMERDGYPFAGIKSLSFDRENSLWVSTNKNGLIQVRESGIVNFSPHDGLSNSKVNIIKEGTNHEFYIGTDAGVVDVYSHGAIKPFPVRFTSPGTGIRDILIDHQGNFWIASYKGLIKIEHGRERLFTEKDGLPATDIRRVMEDKQGNIWVATRSSGIARLNANVVTRLYNKTNGLNSNYILALEEDAYGNIYVGTHSGGLSVINRKGDLKNYSLEKDDTGVLIFNIHLDEQGKVWIVSNIGLLYFNGSRFIPFGFAKIKKGETYFDWVEDKVGQVWITSNIGVYRMKKSDVEKAVEGKIKIIEAKLFDNLDGMKVKECTGATRSILSSTGKLWVPTIGGVSVFYPEKFKANHVQPPVYITSLMADNQEELNTPQGSIAAGKLRYIFQYTALSFISPSKIHFRYKLEGVDENWIEAGSTRQAEYTNLRPGSYVFRVRANNSDGIWNEQGASVSFSVQPFFYQTIWFYLLVVLLLALLLYSVYKWRVMVIERNNAELRKLNNELDRFVYSASHDLRAPLASILGLINVARMDEASQTGQYLKKIEVSVHKLDGFIRDIIDFSRNARVEVETEPIEFDKLIHEIMDNLKYLDEKDLIKRIVNVQETGLFYTDKKRLTIIFNNLISNAIKYYNPHTSRPFIEIQVEANEAQARVVVKDNGIGIAPAHINNIFKMFYRGDEKSRGSGLGLYIVKETLNKINGAISVTSTYGEGSTFTVIIPSRRHSHTQKKQG